MGSPGPHRFLSITGKVDSPAPSAASGSSASLLYSCCALCSQEGYFRGRQQRLRTCCPRDSSAGLAYTLVPGSRGTDPATSARTSMLLETWLASFPKTLYSFLCRQARGLPPHVLLLKDLALTLGTHARDQQSRHYLCLSSVPLPFQTPRTQSRNNRPTDHLESEGLSIRARDSDMKVGQRSCGGRAHSTVAHEVWGHILDYFYNRFAFWMLQGNYGHMGVSVSVWGACVHGVQVWCV